MDSIEKQASLMVVFVSMSVEPKGVVLLRNQAAALTVARAAQLAFANKDLPLEGWPHAHGALPCPVLVIGGVCHVGALRRGPPTKWSTRWVLSTNAVA